MVNVYWMSCTCLQNYLIGTSVVCTCVQQWLLTLARDFAHAEWACTAERPGGHSYLFFEEFTLQVKGAKLQQVTAEVTIFIIAER